MSFNKQETSILVNVKLTDVGRRSLSLGRLNYAKAVVSDREVDYDVDRNSVYAIHSNRIISPKDDNPKLSPFNFDGSPAFTLTNNNLFGGVLSSTFQHPSNGFFPIGIDTGTTLSTSDYEPDSSFILDEDSVSASDLDGTNVASLSSSYYPRSGDLALFIFNTPSNSGSTTGPSDPNVSLWYRVTGDSSSITTDRPLPDFSPGASSETTRVLHYPWNGISNYYGSGSSVDIKLWNMNIVRSNSEIGTPMGSSGYTEYGSREYNGQLHRFGLDNECRQIGLIHYTNEFSGNTYSEQLVPGSVKLDIYNIMWHRYDSNPGEGEQMGNRFTDSDSLIYFDELANCNYTILKDGEEDGFPVGRVYHSLKTIVIMDPELLSAMTYKSNRNWTLPPLILSHRYSPAAGSGVMSSTGCLKSNKTYYVTYYPSTYTNSWDPTESYGYQPFLHCGYIQKITGNTDSDGNNAYLSARFSQRSFPYMRTESGMEVYSGTGWVCNKISLMIKEVDSDSDPGINQLSPHGWKLLETISYSGSQVINASELISHEFVVSDYDLTNATDYILNSAHTVNIDFRNSGSTHDMNFGNEQFFYGNITAKTKRTKHRTVFNLQISEDQLNSSNNPSFNPSLDTCTYFTEVGILDDDDQLVAVGKFTQPVQKDPDQYLILQLEMDF